MLKYLVIQLDDTAPSFCHYSNRNSERKLIAYDALKDGIIWAMKENVMVQFVYPDYELPEEYYLLIDTVDHIDIKPEDVDSDVAIFEGKDSLAKLKDNVFPHPIIRLSKNEFFDSLNDIKSAIDIQSSINIVITDIESFTDEDFRAYKSKLEEILPTIIEKMKSGKAVNVNLLTERLILSSMNNCNAGDETVTLAPDGKFYICPAFYMEGKESIGSPETGTSIRNEQLYKLSHAPICRNCDAFQCKRCIWLNQRTTLEVNTPSHEQCVVAHLERNASRRLLEEIKKLEIIKTYKSIPEVDYLDPFDKLTR